MCADRRRLKFRRDPSSVHDRIAAYDGTERLGHIDRHQGRFYVTIEGFGDIGDYKSEADAKAMLRYYEKQFPLARARRRLAAGRPA